METMTLDQWFAKLDLNGYRQLDGRSWSDFGAAFAGSITRVGQLAKLQKAHIAKVIGNPILGALLWEYAKEDCAGLR
jgi:hypothetical protein